MMTSRTKGYKIFNTVCFFNRRAISQRFYMMNFNSFTKFETILANIFYFFKNFYSNIFPSIGICLQDFRIASTIPTRMIFSMKSKFCPPLCRAWMRTKEMFIIKMKIRRRPFKFYIAPITSLCNLFPIWMFNTFYKLRTPFPTTFIRAELSLIGRKIFKFFFTNWAYSYFKMTFAIAKFPITFIRTKFATFYFTITRMKFFITSHARLYNHITSTVFTTHILNIAYFNYIVKLNKDYTDITVNRIHNTEKVLI